MTALPVTLEMRDCANGETVECFFAVDGQPIYGPSGVGAFLTKPSLEEAFLAALRVVERGEKSDACCGKFERTGFLHNFDCDAVT